MKKTLFILFSLFFVFSKNISAQINLVPNPSFENFTMFPDQYSDDSFPVCLNWYSPTNGSPDYFNKCWNIWDYGMPQNLFGYQYPNTGNTYWGFGVWVFSSNPTYINHREYIQTKLSDSLKSGEKYYVSFYVSLSDSSQYGSDGLGAYVSDTPVSHFGDLSDYCLLPYNPQVYNPHGNIITDSQNWTLISGSFIARGGEKFITIGNFWDDNNTETLKVNNAMPQYVPVSYYYIDDVSVTELPEIEAGNNKICLADSVLLSGSISAGWPGMEFYWQPQAGLSAPYSLQTMASPAVTTTYYLHAKCDSCAEPYKSLAGSLTDSVTVITHPPSGSTDAGKDTTIKAGQSVQLGSPAQTGLFYFWHPAKGLDNPFTAQPRANPERSTVYLLTATNECNYFFQDMITVNVIENMVFPNPAYDIITAINPYGKPAIIEIYNYLGKKVYKCKADNPENTLSTANFSAGMYVYKISDAEGAEKTEKFVILK